MDLSAFAKSDVWNLKHGAFKPDVAEECIAYYEAVIRNFHHINRLFIQLVPVCTLFRCLGWLDGSSSGALGMIALFCALFCTRSPFNLGYNPLATRYHSVAVDP